MCLVALAWQAHPEFPLILAGNRDEAHDRPSAEADWWPDHNQVFGGRDLVAGGSWLAADRSGKIAVVTNYPGHEPAAGNAPSRGHLVRDYLLKDCSPEEFSRQLELSAPEYAGFCLFVGNQNEIWRIASPSESSSLSEKLGPGVLAVSNSPFNQPWPKAIDLQSHLTKMLTHSEPDTDQLFALLSRREPVATESTHPEIDDSQFSRTPFVQNHDYGTRASTLVIVNRTGELSIEERRFDRHGKPAGVSKARFMLSGD